MVEHQDIATYKCDRCGIQLKMATTQETYAFHGPHPKDWTDVVVYGEKRESYDLCPTCSAPVAAAVQKLHSVSIPFKIIKKSADQESDWTTNWELESLSIDGESTHIRTVGVLDFGFAVGREVEGVFTVKG